MTEAPRTATERVLAGRYRLLRVLATGATGTVWEGRDEVLDRPVAVKLLTPEEGDGPAGAERLRRAAVGAARLAHGNVVGVFDTGVDGAELFVVMELVRGTSLRDLLGQAGALDLRRTVELGVQLAEALDCAHRAGVVHGRLTTGDVLVAGEGRVLVGGFGLAGAAGATPAGDVRAAGSVLYEAVCGRPPQPAGGGGPLPPRQLRAGVPRVLEQAILRALAASGEGGLATAADLRAALLTVDVADDDAAALVVRDDTPPEGVPSFGQAERSWLVPAALIVLVSVVLGVVGLLFSRTDVGRSLLRSAPRPPAEGEPARLADPSLFDPEGDGDEHNRELALLVDGDTATTWETHSYSRRPFGGLKSGVGLVFEVTGGRRPLGRLEVASPTTGWSAEVYVADRAATTLAGWGKPVARREANAGDATFDLGGRQGAFVLLWLTDPGSARKAVVGEVRLV